MSPANGGVDAALVTRLEGIAATARQDILQAIANAGAGHTGGSLSVTDILTALYFRVLRNDPERPDWPERDRLVLSKGHASAGFYAVLAARGYFSREEFVENYDTVDSIFMGHPDRLKTPGVETSTGSLGHGLSVAIGMALGLKAKGPAAHVYAVLGDGELDEGQVWEALMYAGTHKVSGLTAIVDFNKLQLVGRVDETMALEPLVPKLESFGWKVVECDGHDIAELIAVLEAARDDADAPVIVLAHTVKGKGVSFIEDQVAWHARVPTPEELEQGLAELEVK